MSGGVGACHSIAHVSPTTKNSVDVSFDFCELKYLVRTIVLVHEPLDQIEAEAKRQFLLQFDQLALPFDRDASLIHVTASAIVTSRLGILLHFHKRLQTWLPPGGHIEPGEMPWSAALREAMEETGLYLEFVSNESPPSLLHIDVHTAADNHTHLDLRFLLTSGDKFDPDPNPGESRIVGWFSISEAITKVPANLRTILLKLQNEWK